MRKTILTVVGSVLLAASAIQIAAAAEHKSRRAERVPPPPVSEPIRGAYAYAFYPMTPYYSAYYSALYEGGAISAPAGH
jgi:hypothetical protein